MSLGTLTMAWALLSVGATPPSDTYPMNERHISIPIRFDAAKRQEIRELDLYCSRDQGLTWKQESVATPSQDSFQFYAPTDGTYWFSLVVKNQKGDTDPPGLDLNHLAPSLKVIVDTQKPILDVRAERKGDEVVVNWNMQEENPDLSTLKLEYKAADSGEWYTAPVTALPNGQTKFTLPRPVPVTVRMKVEDVAHNEAIAEKDVAAPPVPVVKEPSPSSAPAAAPVPFPSNPWPVVTNPPAPSLVRREIPARPETAFPPALPPSGGTASNLYVPGGSGLKPVVASTQEAGTPYPPAPSPEPAREPVMPDAVPFSLVNTRQVTLEYQVDKVGPSGIGRVDLWMTQNNGQTWERVPDNHIFIPTTADVPGDGLFGGRTTSHKPGARTLTVDLPGEGVYGFRMVVQSKASLETKTAVNKHAPNPGDPPDIRVEVDITPPAAELYFPEPNPELTDVLTLSWNVKDRNLAREPITLEWAERQAGPWLPIAKNVSNAGQFAWKLPKDVPAKVHLRLIAKDLAGNVSVAETHEPVTIDLIQPVTHFTGAYGQKQ